MTNILLRLTAWLQRQLKAISFDAWTKDHHGAIRHYKFRAVPVDLTCAQYDVKLVRAKMGGNTQTFHQRWPREKVLELQWKNS